MFSGIFAESAKLTPCLLHIKEFNFQTDRGVQQFPPTEFFSKLSLTTELQQNNGSPVKLSQPTSLSTKDSKENRSTFLQQEREIKEKPSLFGGKQAQDGCMTDADKKLRMRRLGVC